MARGGNLPAGICTCQYLWVYDLNGVAFTLPPQQLRGAAMSRVIDVVLVIALAAAASSAAGQVQCRMPNGVVITQQLGGCPRDAVQITPGGAATAQAVTAAPPPSQQPVAAPVVSDGAAKVPVSGASNDGLSMLAWMLIVGIGTGLVFAIKGSGGTSGPARFCTTCGHEGAAKTKTRGSTAVELVLWLCLFLPGLIYSVWRLANKYKTCSQCGGTALVPPSSPIAVATKKRLSE